jgi:hypothetical protein
MIFKIATLLSRLGSLMICTQDLTVLTKTKETTHYYKSFGYGGKDALNKRFYRSNGVSVPAEEGQIIPIMGISHQCPTAKHKQPNNLINRKEGIRKS